MEFKMFVDNIIEKFVIDNTIFSGLSVFLGVFGVVADIIGFYRPDKKSFYHLRAFIVTILLVVLSYFFTFELILTVFFAVVMCRLFLDVHKRKSTRIEMDFVNSKNESDMEALQEDAELGADYESGMSNRFINAERLIKDKRPQEAINLLKKCSEKEKKQVRYFTYYADALIMMNNFSGALAKMKDIPPDKIKKKRTVKAIMSRKALCYKGLDEYWKELKCYDSIIGSNFKPEKYYYHRGRIKVRIAEVYPYIASLREVVDISYRNIDELLSSAKRDFDKALSYSDKYKAKILSFKGTCAYLSGKKEESLELFEKARELDDSLENTYAYLGMYYYDKQDTTTARKYFERAIECDPADEKPYYYLAKMSYGEKDYEKAILYASKALSCFKYRDDCYGIQGDCYKNREMYTEAIKCYTEAINLNKKASYYSSRALCYYNKQKRNLEESYKDWAACCELEPTEYNQFKMMSMEIIWKTSQKKKYEEEELDHFIEPFKNSSCYYIDIGNLYMENNFPEKAGYYYKKCLEQNPESRTGKYNLAMSYKKNGMYKEAAGLLEDTIKSGSKDPKYYERLLDCYEEMKDTEAMIRTQVRISNVRKSIADALKKNGDAVYELKKYSEAQKYYEEALKYVSDDVRLLNNMGCALCGLYKYQEALKCFEDCKSIRGNYFLAYYNCGNCLLCTDSEQKDKKKIEDNYKMAVKLNGEFIPAARMLKSMDRSEIVMVIDRDSV